MNRLSLLSTFASMPWALEPDYLAMATAVVLRWATGEAADDEVMRAVQGDVAAAAARRDAAARAGGGSIAVIPVYGVITQRQMAQNASGSGSTSAQALSAALRGAVADETISGILLDVDSPGGAVSGTHEFADEVLSARAQKPIYAIANAQAGSAAYWIASCASKLFASPSALVGSIGVFTIHNDISKALDAEGVKRTYISAGKHKVEGNPGEPLSDDAREHIQGIVDTAYSAFTKAVAKGRGAPVAQVRDGMGQGRMVTASNALAANMIDGIATFDEVISLMARDLRASRQPAARAAARARDLEINGA